MTSLTILLKGDVDFSTDFSSFPHKMSAAVFWLPSAVVRIPTDKCIQVSPETAAKVHKAPI